MFKSLVIWNRTIDINIQPLARNNISSVEAALALWWFSPQCIHLAQPLRAEKTQTLCTWQIMQKDWITYLQWLCLWTQSLSTKLHDRIRTKSVSHFVLTHSKKPQSRIGLQFWGRNQNWLVSWINAVKIQDLLTHAKCLCLQMFTSYVALKHKDYQNAHWSMAMSYSSLQVQ